MAERVTIVGAEEVRAAFDALARDVSDLSETHKRVADLLIPGTRQRTPLRTGALAASWRAEASKIAGGVVSGLPYSGPVEYGVPARGMPGARMVADTIAAETDAILAAYETTIRERGKRRGFGTD